MDLSESAVVSVAMYPLLRQWRKMMPSRAREGSHVMEPNNKKPLHLALRAGKMSVILEISGGF
jgi:hypothetical protein